MLTEKTQLTSARDLAIVKCLKIFAQHGWRIRLQRMLEMNGLPDQSLHSGEMKTSLELTADVSEQTDCYVHPSALGNYKFSHQPPNGIP